MKKIISFILLYLSFFFSSIFINYDNGFYDSLNLPFFKIPSFLFGIIWSLIYLLITISFFIVYEKDNSILKSSSYLKTFIVNYLLNQLFVISFFKLESTFLGFVNSLLIFLSSLFLYYETKKIDNTASKLLILYIVWSFFATILSLSIYFLNL